MPNDLERHLSEPWESGGIAEAPADSGAVAAPVTSESPAAV